MAEIAEAEILSDLLSVLNVERKDGESAADFTARVIKKASKCSEETWAELQEPTQEWVNAYLTAEDAKEDDLPLLVAEDDETGAETVEAEPLSEEGVEDVENGKHSNGAAKPKKDKKVKAEKESKKAAPKAAAKVVKGTAKPAKEATGNGRGRAPAKWSVKTTYDLCNSLVPKARKAGIELKERKGKTGFLDRKTAHEALKNVQSAFKKAGVDPGPDLAEAVRAMA